NGVLAFQKDSSSGEPKAEPKNMAKPTLREPCGSSSISAGIKPAAEVNICGYLKANRNAPYPPMETPLMARPERVPNKRNLFSICGTNSRMKKSSYLVLPFLELM